MYNAVQTVSTRMLTGLWGRLIQSLTWQQYAIGTTSYVAPSTIHSTASSTSSSTSSVTRSSVTTSSGITTTTSSSAAPSASPTNIGLIGKCGTSTDDGASCKDGLTCVAITDKLSTCLPINADSTSCDDSGDPTQENYLPCGGDFWPGIKACGADSVCVSIVGNVFSICMPSDSQAGACAATRMRSGGH